MFSGHKIKFLIKIYSVKTSEILYESELENHCSKNSPADCINLNDWSNRI